MWEVGWGHWFSVIELLWGYLSITVIRDRGTDKFNHLTTYYRDNMN